MNEKIVYLDSSAIAKRYFVEEGTGAVDRLYHRAEQRSLRLAFSLWNLGEVLGAVARAVRLGRILEPQARRTTWSVVNETLKLHGLGGLRLVPVRGDLLAEGVPLLFRHGLALSDALQIATTKDVHADAFVCADEKLLRAARAEGLNSIDPAGDERLLEAL